MTAPDFVSKQPLPLGFLTPAAAGFPRGTDDPGKFKHTGVKDPTGQTDEVWDLNKNRSGQGDGHSTFDTTRKWTQGDRIAVACNGLYLKKEDLIQTGRNLVLQTEMQASPNFALRTLNGRFEWVTRTGITNAYLAQPIMAIPWGHKVYIVVRMLYANGPNGEVEGWFGVDGPPDVNKPPSLHRVGFDSWGEEDAHWTVGQYSTHGAAGEYRFYWNRFGIDGQGNPLEAIRLAGLTGSVTPPPPPPPVTTRDEAIAKLTPYFGSVETATNFVNYVAGDEASEAALLKWLNEGV